MFLSFLCARHACPLNEGRKVGILPSVAALWADDRLTGQNSKIGVMSGLATIQALPGSPIPRRIVPQSN